MAEIFFELPGTSIRGIPIQVSKGRKLLLGIVEVGCKPHSKRKKLGSKRELLLEYWQQNYREPYHLNWKPQIYRAVAHYSPKRVADEPFHSPRNQVDMEISYSFITKEMLGSLTEEDKRQIFKIVTGAKKRRDLLEEILAGNEAERLHQHIVQGANIPQECFLRGKMAEILVLKDLERTLPPGMNLFRNGDVRFFNQTYTNGTEIDAIQTFYSERVYVTQVESLRSLDHLRVRDRWHSS
ncbi:MAG: hypothetical protein ABIH82_04005 [Candidatus Woesearchaeota archaeon]